MSVTTEPSGARSALSATGVPRTAIATVCISGTLEDKLAAAAAAGFDGVEIFEPDFVASPSSAAEIRKRCADLGLSIDLYQPFRDFDSTDPERLAANLRRAERKFDVMEALGTDLVLVCSSVSPDAVDDDGRIAEQLHVLAERAAARGVRVSYEALAWGRHVNTYDRSWEIVRRADHPALGLCVDSFHILSRGSDPAGIRDIPGEKLFFLQLADAPHMDMNVLQWSRHHRLFPGQGAFDLPAFLGHVLVAGYTGPLSLEVFNDVFRQADPRRAAVDALRSLLALDEAVHDHLADDPAWRTRETAARPRQGAGRCPTPRSCTASRSPSSRSTTSAARRSPARSRRSASPAPAPIAPSPSSCGRTGRRGCCSTPSRRLHGAPPSRRSASRSTTHRPPRSGRRRCSRRCSPAPAVRPRRTCRPSPHRTARRCSSAARVPRTAGSPTSPPTSEPRRRDRARSRTSTTWR